MSKLVVLWALNVTVLMAQASFAWEQRSANQIKLMLGNEVRAKRSPSIVVGIITARGRQVIRVSRLSTAKPHPPDGNTMYDIAVAPAQLPSPSRSGAPVSARGSCLTGVAKPAKLSLPFTTDYSPTGEPRGHC